MAGVTSGSLVDGSGNLITIATVQRPASERPAHDTVDEIAKWLNSDARRNPSFSNIFDEFAWRLLAADIPVLRVSLHLGTLHPQFLGATYVWWRDTGQSQKIMIAHEVADLIPYSENAVRRVREGGETLRRPAKR